MTGVIVRRATRADVPAICAIYASDYLSAGKDVVGSLEAALGDPWERRVALPPMMSRADFMDMARSIYDCWQIYRPAPTFVVLEGGCSSGGGNAR